MLNQRQYKKYTSFRVNGTQWYAETALKILCGTEYKYLYFRTEQIERKIKTHYYIVDLGAVESKKPFKGTICYHPALRPTQDIIRDAHLGAMLEFNDYILKAKEYYYKSPLTIRIQKIIEMHKVDFYTTQL